MNQKLIDPSKEEYVYVDPRYINEAPDETTDIEVIEMVKKDIQQLKLEEPELLKIGIDFARNAIINLEKRYRLVIKDREEMSVAYLSAEVYQDIYTRLTKVEDGHSVAGALPEIDQVLVSRADNPDYYQASVVFHEFIHKFIDRKVTALGVIARDDYEEVVSEARRVGMMVRNISNRDANLENDSFGEFLNELGNYAYQKQFITALLKEEAFKEEAAQREKLLTDMGFINNNDVNVLNIRITENNTQKVRFNRDNTFFDNNGNKIITLPVLAMQLGCDMDMLCGKSEKSGLWFSQLLIDAKIDPAVQSELRDLVDKNLGKGFYRKLRRAQYNRNDFLEILAEVQKKLYQEDS